MKEIPLTREYVEGGNLQVGDTVYPTVNIKDRTGRYFINAGEICTVSKVDPSNTELPGYFSIKHSSGQDWPFSFDTPNALGQYFVKRVLSAEETFFEKFGELPYFILSTLHDNIQLSVKAIVTIVMNDKMLITLDNMSSVKRQIEYCIQALVHYNYIVEFQPGDYTLTSKGKNFLNE